MLIRKTCVRRSSTGGTRTNSSSASCEHQVEECRWLYNHLLAERRDAWEQRQESVRMYDQHATLPTLKVERPSLARVQSQVLQNVAVRIDLAFQAYLRRVKAGA
jgi:putative transposase